MRIRDESCRPRWRPKCEQFLRLDIRALARKGLLSPGSSAYLPLTSHDAGQSATVRIVAEEDCIRVLYAWTSRGGKSASTCCHIQLERTSCHYGGARLWFRCPRCDSRRAILFGLAPYRSFGCWGCMDVVYASQDARKMCRLWRRQAKLEGLLVGGYRRPRGMHWRTLNHIYKCLDAVLSKQDRLFCDGARALMRRRGWLC